MVVDLMWEEVGGCFWIFWSRGENDYLHENENETQDWNVPGNDTILTFYYPLVWKEEVDFGN